MTDYEKPAALKLEGNIEVNFDLFRQEVELFFTATETNKKAKEIRVARLLNLFGTDARKIYFQIKDEVCEQTVTAILDALKKTVYTKKEFGNVSI